MSRPLVAVVLLSTAVVCCRPRPEAPAGGLRRGFLWGTAIAGFQAEMGCPSLPSEQCEDRRSDWYQFITDPEFRGLEYLSGHAPSQGPGHWELYEQDYAQAAGELKNNALRTSLEWSRLFPNPTDAAVSEEEVARLADPKALAHYHAMLASMRAHGLTPLITLNHYTLPSWLHDAAACHRELGMCTRRGWLDRERAVREIAKYARFAAREFGGEVDLWATLNEPFAVVMPGYLLPGQERANPPAVGGRFEEAREVLVALIEAHARMYEAVRGADQVDADGDGASAQVGLVLAAPAVTPKNPQSPVDRRAAENIFYIHNRVFLAAVTRGDFDPELDGVASHREDLAGHLDYLGINYYTRVTVEGTAGPMFPSLSPLTNFNPVTLRLWEVYPKGLYEMAMLAKEYGVYSIITENGAEDSGEAQGPGYLVRHLTWLTRAVRDGADVRGYFYWTLFDNYEWNHGMNMRLGLYAVDPADPTRARVARERASTYAQICEHGGVPDSLAAAFPEPE